MTNKLLVTSITIVLFSVATVEPGAQETSENEVKVEVRAAWDFYIEAFSNARTDIVSRDIYAAPSYQLGVRSGSLRRTTADTKTAFDAIHRSLAKDRYDRTETEATEVCVINAGAALLTARFTRYRNDNSVITNGASAYLFGKLDVGWRIVAIIGNPTAKLITCDQN